MLPGIKYKEVVTNSYDYEGGTNATSHIAKPVARVMCKASLAAPLLLLVLELVLVRVLSVPTNVSEISESTMRYRAIRRCPCLNLNPLEFKQQLIRRLN